MLKRTYQIAQWAFPLLILVFIAQPQVDVFVSKLFWSAEQGFEGKNIAWMFYTHKYIGVVVALAFLSILVAWLISLFKKGPETLKAHRKSLSYLLLAIILGPGLLVNVLFKDQWGRARPAQVQEFGGERLFTPAWIPSNQCGHNCSFVCGDASVGFILAVGAFISRRPRLWFAAGILVGGILGYMRIVQGGHFLSDVIFSWYCVIFSAWLLGRLMRLPGIERAFVKSPNRLDEYKLGGTQPSS